nr:hypothetical protein [Tanacetum cinerariifolium]
SSQGVTVAKGPGSENASLPIEVARREKRIQDRELEIKNLEVRLETESAMKRAVEDKNAELVRELEDIRRRWVIGHGLRLAMMKCGESVEMRQAFADVVSAGIAKGMSEGLKHGVIAKGMSEGLKHGVEHGRSQLGLESIEAYDPKAEAKFVAALQSLKDLKFSLLDQLEGLKDAPMDVIMAALYLESDTGGDVLQYIRDLRPSSSQLSIPVYPEVRDPRNPWACKEEVALADAIAANISRAEKKKKCRIVCQTHGVGSAHHARSDGIPVSVLAVVPQGLVVLLVDGATQTDPEECLL